MCLLLSQTHPSTKGRAEVSRRALALLAERFVVVPHRLFGWDFHMTNMW